MCCQECYCKPRSPWHHDARSDLGFGWQSAERPAALGSSPHSSALIPMLHARSKCRGVFLVWPRVRGRLTRAPLYLLRLALHQSTPYVRHHSASRLVRCLSKQQHLASLVVEAARPTVFLAPRPPVRVCTGSLPAWGVQGACLARRCNPGGNRPLDAVGNEISTDPVATGSRPSRDRACPWCRGDAVRSVWPCTREGARGAGHVLQRVHERASRYVSRSLGAGFWYPRLSSCLERVLRMRFSSGIAQIFCSSLATSRRPSTPPTVENYGTTCKVPYDLAQCSTRLARYKVQRVPRCGGPCLACLPTLCRSRDSMRQVRPWRLKEVLRWARSTRYCPPIARVSMARVWSSSCLSLAPNSQLCNGHTLPRASSCTLKGASPEHRPGTAGVFAAICDLRRRLPLFASTPLHDSCTRRTVSQATFTTRAILAVAAVPSSQSQMSACGLRKNARLGNSCLLPGASGTRRQLINRVKGVCQPHPCRVPCQQTTKHDRICAWRQTSTTFKSVQIDPAHLQFRVVWIARHVANRWHIHASLHTISEVTTYTSQRHDVTTRLDTHGSRFRLPRSYRACTTPDTGLAQT